MNKIYWELFCRIKIQEEQEERNMKFKGVGEKRLSVGCLVRFCDISTIVGYLMPNPLYTYILNIYDSVWLGFMTYQQS